MIRALELLNVKAVVDALLRLGLVRNGLIIKCKFEKQPMYIYGNTHPAPLNLRHIRKLVANYSAEGWLLCDPFMGSGTLIQAAREANRRCIGIDISEEEYCEISAKRCSQMVFDLRI